MQLISSSVVVVAASIAVQAATASRFFAINTPYVVHLGFDMYSRTRRNSTRLFLASMSSSVSPPSSLGLEANVSGSVLDVAERIAHYW